MVEITLPIVLQLFQTAGILIGIVYYITIMRNQQKTRELALKAQEQATETRQTQIFMQIYQQLDTEKSHKTWAELVNQDIGDYDEYLSKYDSSVNPDHYAKRAHHWYTFNTIGELLRMDIIDVDLLHRLSLDPLVNVMWEKWEHIILEIRKNERGPDLWEGFEYLYKALKKFRNEKGYPEHIYPKQA